MSGAPVEKCTPHNDLEQVRQKGPALVTLTMGALNLWIAIKTRVKSLCSSYEEGKR